MLVRLAPYLLILSYQLSVADDGLKSNHDNVVIEDSVILEELNSKINGILENYKLTWNEVEYQVDSIQRHYESLYGVNSLSNALIFHKKGLVQSRQASRGGVDYNLAAIQYYKSALEIRQKIHEQSGYDIVPEIIRGYNNIALNYFKLEDIYTAINYYLKGFDLLSSYSNKQKSYRIRLDLNFNLAKIYKKLGDYDNAIIYYENVMNDRFQGRSNEELYFIKNRKIMATNECGGMIANYLRKMNNARRYLISAQEMLKDEEQPDGLRASNFNNLGIMHFRLDQFDSAKYFHQKSAEIRKRLGRNLAVAQSYTNLVAVYNELRQTDSAAYFLNEAFNLYKEYGKGVNLSVVLDNQADLEFLHKNFANSLEYHNRALEYLVPGFKAKSIFSFPRIQTNKIADKEGLLYTLNAKGKRLLFLYGLQSQTEALECAFITFKLADEVVSMMRSDFRVEASRMSFASYSKPIYEGAVEACFHLYNMNPQDTLLAKAFEYSEKSRAIVLLDAVRKSRARTKVDPELINQERHLNIKVNHFETLNALANADIENKLSFNVFDSLTRYQAQRNSIIDQIKLESPDYHRIIFEEATTSIEEIKNTLEEDQSFVEFFVGDSSVYTFVINRDTTLFLKMDEPDSIRKWSNEWIKAVKQQKLDFLEPGHKLYTALIEPVADVLGEKLILVPDDVLNLVNFDALVTKLPSGDNINLPDFKEFMIYDHQMSYAFSASTLMENQNNSKGTTSRFLGVAPRMDQGFELLGEWFDELDQNEEQVEEASHFFAHQSIVPQNAAKASFLDVASDYDVIHCAAHALANNKDGDLSFILFGEEESDILYAKDLYAQELTADMVVLSACQTSEGELNRGEGVISLARSFTYAGAASVVTSLWSVRENVNHKIINDFYRHLKSGKSKDEALRQAKIEYRENLTLNDAPSAHPYFWAPLIVIGDTENTFPNRQSTLILIIAALAMFALMLIYLKRSKTLT